jgi:hypothetical protein
MDAGPQAPLLAPLQCSHSPRPCWKTLMLRALFFFLFGVYVCIEFMLFFDRNDGGVMPIAQMIGIILGLGGIAFFSLFWTLIRYRERRSDRDHFGT